MRWSRFIGSTLVKHFPILQVESKNLTWEDIASIWSSISSIVERHLDKKKGIKLPGLGTFAYITKRIDLGMNVLQSDQHPIFILEDKLALVYGLKRLNVYIEDEVPIRQLNLAVLANLLACDDPRLKYCYTNVMKKIEQHLMFNKPFELPFPGVGKLKYSRYNYKFIFNADFMNTHRIIETQVIKHMEPSSDQEYLHVVGCKCNKKQMNSKGNKRKNDKPPKETNKISRSIKQVNAINKKLQQESCGDVVEDIMNENVWHDLVEHSGTDAVEPNPCEQLADRLRPCALSLQPPCIINCDKDSLKAMLPIKHDRQKETTNWKRIVGGQDMNDLSRTDFAKGDQNRENISNTLTKYQNLPERDGSGAKTAGDSSLQCECSSMNEIPDDEEEDPYNYVECLCEKCHPSHFTCSCDPSCAHSEPLKKSRSTSSMVQEKSTMPKRPHTSKCSTTSRTTRTPICLREKFTYTEDCVHPPPPPTDRTYLPLAFRMETNNDDPEWFCEECRERAYLEFIRQSRCRLKEKQLLEDVAHRQFLELQHEESNLNDLMKAKGRRENLRKESLSNRDHGEFQRYEARLAKQMANDHNNQYVFWNRPKTPSKDEVNKAYGKDLEQQLKCKEQQMKLENEKSMCEDIAQRDYFMDRYADDVEKERQQKRQDHREMRNALLLQQSQPRPPSEPGTAFVMPYEQREKYLNWVKKRGAAERKENWETYMRKKEEMENEHCAELQAEANMLAKLQEESGKDTGWKYWKKRALLNETIQNVQQAMREKHERELLDKYYWDRQAPTNLKSSHTRQCHNCCRTFELGKKEHATWRMEERWPYREVHYALAS